MPSVQLDDEEWQRIMSVLATAPWNIANPLLMKIGDQLRVQKNSGAVHFEEKEKTVGSRGRGQGG